MACPDRAPVLVTGVPRSGTTWLARRLADAPGVCMPGREPMNPRPGQFALGGTLDGWTVLADLSARQRTLLRRCYAGREPRTLSRYGLHQWRALRPGTRTVVKDPFALLSVPALGAGPGALPVVVHRHPAAQLASYRRMGWTADTAEVRALVGRTGAPWPRDDVDAMGEFWALLHAFVLDWLPRVPRAVVVDHAELSRAGDAGVAAVRRAAGLPPVPNTAAPQGVPRPRAAGDDGRLHRFDRAPQEAAEGWRSRVHPADVARLEAATAGVRAALAARTLRLTADRTAEEAR